MNVQNKNLLLILGFVFCLFLPGVLFAEQGYYDGRFLLEIRGTYGVDHSGGISNNVENAYEPDIPFYHYVFPTTEAQRTEAWTYRLLTAEKPEVESYGGDLMFEWAISDWFGLGFSLRTAQYNASGYRPLYDIGASLGFLAYLSSSTQSLLLTLEKFETVIVEDLKLTNVHTLNFDMSFHFMDRSAFDPYIRISLGLGKETEESANAARGGVALGMRYFFTDNAFVSVDGEYAAYTFVASPQQSQSGSAVLENINETNAHFGIGYAW